jgi:predicted DNA-binding protein YlxM (UPF0122 family)
MSKFKRIEELPATVLLDVRAGIYEPIILAQYLQKQGYFTDVAEATLTQLVGAYRKSLKIPEGTSEDSVPDEFNPLAEILAVAKQQKERVRLAVSKEKEINMPLDATNKVIQEYQQTLALMQKMQIERDLADTKVKLPAGSNNVTARIKDMMRWANTQDRE